MSTPIFVSFQRINTQFKAPVEDVAKKFNIALSTRNRDPLKFLSLSATIVLETIAIAMLQAEAVTYDWASSAFV